MMTSSRKILIVCVALTLLFIWVNSMLPGDISSQQSGWVMQLVQPVLDFIHSGRIQVFLTRAAGLLPQRIQALAGQVIAWLDTNILSRDSVFLVRKAAHLSEYMLLGFFMGLLMARSDGRGRLLLPGGACLVTAAVDETIQLFTDQRTPRVRDVCIDMTGAVIGLIVTLILLAVLRGLSRSRGPKSGKIS